MKPLMPQQVNGNNKVAVMPPKVLLRKNGTKEGGGNYLSYDSRFYVIRNSDKYWVWGKNTLNDRSEILSQEAGDDEQYNTKADCVTGIEKFLYEEALDLALWEN